MHPKHLSIKDFTYNLPEQKIARYPLSERDQSKLLIWKNGGLKEDIYHNIAEYIPENSLLVFNNTKVIAARILFRKETGGLIEIFCLEPFEQDYATAMSAKGTVSWKCMIGGASKWKTGNLQKEIRVENKLVKISVTLIKHLPDAYVTEIKWQPEQFTFSEIIDTAGDVPLPPYIKRKTEESDKERYQTIFAKQQGSVAAPTAGLHFSPGIFSSLIKRKIATDFVTLHVGAGTFKPVKAEVMEQHQMHAEWMDVSLSTIQNIKNNIDGIVAVGTTSLRTIESLYWMGVKACLNGNCNLHELEIEQWEVYEKALTNQSIDAAAALEALLLFLRRKKLEKIVIKTHILIAPGYTFKIASALVTNFHQPESTLLLLMAAITKEWRGIYEYALQNNFRFLSYGDGCLLFV